jgi:hypothetical protein
MVRTAIITYICSLLFTAFIVLSADADNTWVDATKNKPKENGLYEVCIKETEYTPETGYTHGIDYQLMYWNNGEWPRRGSSIIWFKKFEYSPAGPEKSAGPGAWFGGGD